MPSAADYAAKPVAATLHRLSETPVELGRVVTASDDAPLSRQPEPASWSAKEIVCHLRDVEELFQLSFHTILALDEPMILVLGANSEELAHPARGRLALAQWAASLAGHDDNHLAQLARAL